MHIHCNNPCARKLLLISDCRLPSRPMAVADNSNAGIVMLFYAMQKSISRRCTDNNCRYRQQLCRHAQVSHNMDMRDPSMEEGLSSINTTLKYWNAGPCLYWTPDSDMHLFDKTEECRLIQPWSYFATCLVPTVCSLAATKGCKVLQILHMSNKQSVIDSGCLVTCIQNHHSTDS